MFYLEVAFHVCNVKEKREAKFRSHDALNRCQICVSVSSSNIITMLAKYNCPVKVSRTV